MITESRCGALLEQRPGRRERFGGASEGYSGAHRGRDCVPHGASGGCRACTKLLPTPLAPLCAPRRVPRRWLLIPLVSAERAWAQAMEIKKDNEDRPLPHRRHHSIRRLTKASAWAADLARFAAGGLGRVRHAKQDWQNGSLQLKSCRVSWVPLWRLIGGAGKTVLLQNSSAAVALTRAPLRRAPQRWPTPAAPWRPRPTARGCRATCCWRRRWTGRARWRCSRAQGEMGRRLWRAAVMLALTEFRSSKSPVSEQRASVAGTWHRRHQRCGSKPPAGAGLPLTPCAGSCTASWPRWGTSTARGSAEPWWRRSSPASGGSRG